MTYLQKLKGHLFTVIAHRYEVFKACNKARQFWRGLTHDLSKFSPTEFFQYVKYFEVGKSPRDVALDRGEVFTAWRHHVGHNPHHWEYWLDRQKGEVVPIQMPYPYLVEMICDWIGASKTYAVRNKKQWSINTLHEWYERTKGYQIFHIQTSLIVNWCMMFCSTEKDIYDCLKALKLKG